MVLGGIIANFNGAGTASNLTLQPNQTGDTITVNGANTYSGTTSIGGAAVGTIIINNAAAFGTSTVQFNFTNLQVGTSGGLSLSNAFQVAHTSANNITGSNALTMIGGLTNNLANGDLKNNSTAPLTISTGNVNLGTATGSGFTFILGGSGAINISSVIQDWSGGAGTSHGSLTYNGTGSLTLNGANTYGGATSVGSGTLTIGSSGALGSGGGTAIAISGTGTLIDSATSNGITGTSSLAVSSGTATLANANNFSGTTTVSGTRHAAIAKRQLDCLLGPDP